MVSATSLVESVIGTGALDRSSLFNVEGWVAIVTGGGTGLGLVSAITLATNGCKVYIVGRRLEPLQRVVRDYAEQISGSAKAKGSIEAIQADVSCKEGVDELVKVIKGKESHINLLLNNHGVSLGCADINACEQTPKGLSEHMYGGEDMDMWLDTYRINTASYYFTTFALLPLLAAAGKDGGQPGNVINISSISGITKTSQRGQFNYNASKAATISLSHQLAYEFARRNLNIRVNVVAPGYFPSGMTVISKESNDGSQSAYRDFRDNWAIPFGRPGSAADHAQIILSVATNQYMTGAEIVVDGGWLLESGKPQPIYLGKYSAYQ